MRRLIVVIVAMVLCMSAPWGWAGFDEGVNAYSRGDYATALREWLPLAQQGNTRAQFNLGLMYDEGRGMPQDYGQAYLWFNLAAANFSSDTDREKAVHIRDWAATRLTPVQLTEVQ